MQELSLLGVHPDGEHLILVDGEGERFSLPIDEELRGALRRGREAVDSIRAAAGAKLSPRDIQAMIRAGASAEEVAATSGLPLEAVARYEAPILGERRWYVQMAQETRISREVDSPRLGELVIDRLATRGVDLSTLEWDAVRAPGAHPTVRLSFIQDARALEASWEFDNEARQLYALDEQARWLTETTTPGYPSLPTLTPPATPRAGAALTSATDAAGSGRESGSAAGLGDVGRHGHQPDAAELSQTEAILEDLAQARGTRLQVATGDEDDDASAMAAAIASGFSEDLDLDQYSRSGREQGAETGDGAADSDGAEGDAAGSAGASAGGGAGGRVVDLRRPVAGDSPEAAGDKAAGDKAAGAEPGSPAGGEEEGLFGMEEVGQQSPPPPPPADASARRRGGRRSVPSWDEIVFGAKPE